MAIPYDDLASLEAALLELERSIAAIYGLAATRQIATETAQQAVSFAMRQANLSLASIGAPADLGVNPLATDANLRRLVESWTTKNVELIQSVGEQARVSIQETVLTGYANGASWRSIVEEVEKGLNGNAGRFRTVENRAKLIARNEIGNLNSALMKYRFTDAGIQQYVWITAGDERVRASHRVLAGNTYSIEGDLQAPGGIFPGSEIQCRCVPQPLPPKEPKDE
jgi:SPP1 gp7 family putative phage head morphogenesis protein